MKKNTVYIETYGCQMNEYDSGIVKSILKENGFSDSKSPEDADLILLNTCAVREKAHEKVFGRLENLSHLKQKNPDLLIGVLGCMAQNLGEKISEKGLSVDIILGPDNYRDLPDLLLKKDEKNDHQTLSRTILSRDETYENIEPMVVRGKLAFVTIMRGCNNFCTFCVVPYTRGRERSRSGSSIIHEIQNLVNQGIKEVTLLGQNVNSYTYEKTDFTDLVKNILDQTEIERLRFTSPHPMDFPEKLLKLMADEKRFCSHIHLPLQSGSSTVLKRMKRGYSREDFLNLINFIRKSVPGVGITTDIIVGFSGETDSEFQETLSAVRESKFDMAYMFKYSERENTVASKNYPDDVPEDIKKERLNQLIQVQNGISKEINLLEIGTYHDVLIEGPSKRSEESSAGRTSSNKVVILPGVFESGKIVKVKITDSTQATLFGSPV